MMRKVIACLLLCVFIVGCQTNVTPALIASQKIEDIGVNAIDTIDSLVKDAKGLDEETRKKILDFSKAEKAKFLLLMSGLRKYIESAGKIDWKELAEHAFDLYLKLRDRI